MNYLSYNKLGVKKVKHYNNEIIKIEDGLISFTDLYQKDYIPSVLLESIKQANILLIPQEKFRDCNGLFFPEQTYDFYNYLTFNAKEKGINVDICCTDEDYKEVQLHNDFIRIVEMIVENPMYDILIGIIANYLYGKVSEIKKKRNEVKTEVKVTVECNGKSKRVSYVGDVENFEKIMKAAKETLFD